jgi:hypothetical protein
MRNYRRTNSVALIAGGTTTSNRRRIKNELVFCCNFGTAAKLRTELLAANKWLREIWLTRKLNRANKAWKRAELALVEAAYAVHTARATFEQARAEYMEAHNA